MSRNSKNAKRTFDAKQVSKARVRGERRNPYVKPEHGKKVRAWANQPGVKRSSLTYTPGYGWSRANPN